MKGYGTILMAVAAVVPVRALAEYTTKPLAHPGRIDGHVGFAGTPPSLPPEQRNRDPQVCGSSHADETLVVGPGGGLANAVVYLADIKAGKAPKSAAATLDQTGCTYVPHVQAVEVGSTLDLLNGDPLLHNIHALDGQTSVFNYAMPASLKRIPKKLTRPGFLTIKCDVHPWMNGVVAVMDNPYFAVTGPTGDFSLNDVPPGTYMLTVWHERLGTQTKSISVSAGQSEHAQFSFTTH